jgi:hypothetical protein
MKRSIFLILTIAAMTTAVFADWKLTQKTKISGDQMGRTSTIYQKGVRMRREEKIDMGKDGDDPEVAAMMSQMGQSMPTFPVHVSQCDLKQDLFINEKNRAFFIDYYDWSSLPPEKLKRRPNQKMVIKGTMTTDTFFTDSGKRQQMFGLAARWLKVTQIIETSADSCDGASSTKIEQEGWFVTLSLESESCPIQRPPGESGGCRPRLIIKRAQNPGIMITGTMRVYDGAKVSASFEIETMELSKATLDPGLFDIPSDYVEVDSQQDLMSARVGVNAAGNKVLFKDGSKADEKRRIAIDYFSGSASKLDQDQLRKYIADKVSAAGYNGTVIGSAADLTSGTFSNVIGVEVRKAKESGASKVGGLFGKVTGSDSLAKAGKSQAEIVVTLYGSDGKTVVASAPANADVSGGSNDAVKAAIDQVISGLISKIK